MKNLIFILLALVLVVRSARLPRQAGDSGWSWGEVQRPQGGNRPDPPPLIRPTRPVRPTVTEPTRPQVPPTTPGDSNGQIFVPMPPPAPIAACLANCRTTPEYNPVCGNDGNTYHNRERLNCQDLCDTNTEIRFVRLGTCSPL